MPPTYAQWLKNAPLARLEARMLLEKVSGYSRAQIIVKEQERLPEKWLTSLEDLLSRRLNGEPMAYILGEREFYGRLFTVSPAVLIPRAETEHLLEAALETLSHKKTACVWDMGCGSGILAISIKLARMEDTVWASDISQAALDVTADNAKKFGISLQLTQGDWFHCERLPEKKNCDVIVANPPYIEANDAHLTQGDLRFEPLNALTDHQDGLSAIRTLAQSAGIFLKKGGFLWLEHGWNQGEPTRAILDKHGFQHIRTERDLAGLERISGGIWVD